ncbi:hypothetical protein AGMMS50229_20640 [Campylobacterota bacterium]|nr:hypothetical protein AGMMS50229_20640 [Campylobacterota bacterium]
MGVEQPVIDLDCDFLTRPLGHLAHKLPTDSLAAILFMNGKSQYLGFFPMSIVVNDESDDESDD